MNDIAADRMETYGHPADFFFNHEMLMQAWEAIRASTEPVTPMSPRYETCVDGAVRMVLFKLTRLARSPNHRDTIHDAIGYLRTLELCLDAEEGG